MAEPCKDCQWNGVCTEFARCILEPIPEDYGRVTPASLIGPQQLKAMGLVAKPLSTGEILGSMLSDEAA